MTEAVLLPFEELRPSAEAVLEHQGIPPGVEPGTRILELYHRAVEILEEEVAPKGIWREVTGAEFDTVFRGQGDNAPEAPLAGIFPRASRLALFAVTLGPRVVARIGELFAERDYPLGAMLDSAASEATELAGEVIVARFRAGLTGDSGSGCAAGSPDLGALLRYSPGYCGWHMSGQPALFEALEPGRIGITLRPSFLMEPLKSMTGVMVAGPPEIHQFEPDFPFCAECVSHSCRRRMQEVADPRS